MLISSNKQCIEYEEYRIKIFRNNNGGKYDGLILLMDKILVFNAIDKARYNGGTLEGTSIQKLLQNANEILTDFKDEIMKIITEKNILKIVDE